MVRAPGDCGDPAGAIPLSMPILFQNLVYPSILVDNFYFLYTPSADVAATPKGGICDSDREQATTGASTGRNDPAASGRRNGP